MSTAIIIPTYRRPHTVPTLVANLTAASGAAHTILFVVEADDAPTIEAIRATPARHLVNRGAPTYAACIQQGFEASSEPFVFCGADDLQFGLGWLARATEAMADPTVGVVGCLDPLHPFGDHAAHSLLRRRYIEEQGGTLDALGRVLHPYVHGWADWELVSVAKVRGAYRFCPAAAVCHIHPGWDKAGAVRTDSALFDPTYAKGNEGFAADHRTFVERSAAWRDALRDLPGRSSADDHILRVLFRAHHPRLARWLRPVTKRRAVRRLQAWWRDVRRRERDAGTPPSG